MSNEFDQYLPPQPPGPRKAPTGAVLGYNLLGFLIYAGLGYLSGESGLIISFLLAVMQFIFCMIMAVVQQHWPWALAAVMILLLGLGTCVVSL